MSRLTCAQVEGMLLDAADGLLLPDEQTHFELHLAECPACSKLYADVRQGSAWMDILKEAPPVPPADLVHRILTRTSGDATAAAEFTAQAAHAASLFGDSRSKVLPFQVPVHLLQPQTRMQRMVHAVMQPRFVMTAAMAFFSLALTLNLAGVRLSAFRVGDLRPTNLKKKYWAANSRVVQYYDNLRVVYELESRVREMQRENDTESTPRRGIMNQPEKDGTQRGAPAGTPRSSSPQRRQSSSEHTGVRHARLQAPTLNPTISTAADSGTHGVQA